MPPTLRVLCLANPREFGHLLAQGLQAAEIASIDVQVAERLDEALKSLQHVAFDALLMVHAPPKLCALQSLRSFRSAIHDHQPILILSERADGNLESEFLAQGADAFASLDHATVPQLLWKIAGVIERQNLLAETKLLQRTREQHRALEQQEVDQQLQQLWSLMGVAPSGTRPTVPPEDATLVRRYAQLLRDVTVAGGELLQPDFQTVKADFCRRELSPPQVVRIHISALEIVLADVGTRGARHLLGHAQVLLLKFLVET